MKPGDQIPGPILRSVVDEYDSAGGTDQVLLHQGMHLRPQSFRRLRQNLLLVIAGDDKIQRRRFLRRCRVYILSYIVSGFLCSDIAARHFSTIPSICRSAL